MTVATTTKPLLKLVCDCCQRASAAYRQVAPDGSGFLLCSPCVMPIEGASLFALPISL